MQKMLTEYMMDLIEYTTGLLAGIGSISMGIYFAFKFGWNFINVLGTILLAMVGIYLILSSLKELKVIK